MVLIADSGSTKTAWCLSDGRRFKQFVTSGINPYQMEVVEMVELLRMELLPELNGQEVGPVWFYGAGCTAEKVGVVESALREVFRVDTSVGSDMLGAARGLSGCEAGIVCILGTGSNSCCYDGNDIVANVPPLGYVLGDEGSGAYIGRCLVGNCVKRQFSKELCDLFFAETGLTTAEIVQRTYRESLPNRFLAGLSLFCAHHRDSSEVHDFLVGCFRAFLQRNVSLYEGWRHLPVHFVGSIAWQYEEELRETLERCGFRAGRIMKEPMAGLIEYHLKE